MAPVRVKQEIDGTNRDLFAGAADGSGYFSAMGSRHERCVSFRESRS